MMVWGSVYVNGSNEILWHSKEFHYNESALDLT